MDEFKKYWLPRILIGAPAGIAVYLFISWLTQPGSLFGGMMSWDFTFCFNGNVPDAVGLVLGLLLWALFGAEVAVATIPFADSGKELVVRTAAHFVVTNLTVGAWAALNFPNEPFFALPEFLIPLAVAYFLIWLTRWVGWSSEVADIREKLGLSPAPSPLKWRETLPYLLLLGAIYALALPVLAIFDDGHIPLLTGFLSPYIIFPILAGAVGFSSGKHCGFTVLVPVAVYLLSLLNDFWLWLAKVLGIANMAYGYVTIGLIYAAIALVLHALGALVRARKRQQA